jgi:hypothetical protein
MREKSRRSSTSRSSTPNTADSRGPIDVDQQVSEPRHQLELLRQAGIDHTGLLYGGEATGIVLGAVRREATIKILLELLMRIGVRPVS